MIDSEIAHLKKKKNFNHRRQKRKVSYKQKAIRELKSSYEQNAFLLRQGYGRGGTQDKGKLQKGGAKRAMEPASSSESSDDPVDAPKTKVVVRHLPPYLSEKAFTESIPSHFSGIFNWISFKPGKPSKKRSTSRAYIDFKHPEDVPKFFEDFNGQSFVNERGTQYRALVEYAPHQTVPKLFPQEDTQEGSILEDREYLEFLDSTSKPIKSLPSAEVQLERKEAEKRSSIAAAAGANKTSVATPPMEYVRCRRSQGTQNAFVASRKKSARQGSSSLADSIISSKHLSNISSTSVKCTAAKVKSSVKLPYVSPHLLEANQGKELSLDAKRKALFEVREKGVMLEKNLAEMVQSDQKFGSSRHSGICRQSRKERRLQHTGVGEICKHSTGFGSLDKHVWVAKSPSGSSAK